MRTLKKIIIVVVLLCVVAGLIIGWGAALKRAGRDTESKHVMVRIIETGTTPGSALSSGKPWTLCELPGGRRIHLNGIWGTPGEETTVRVYRYQAPELFDREEP